MTSKEIVESIGEFFNVNSDVYDSPERRRMPRDVAEATYGEAEVARAIGDGYLKVVREAGVEFVRPASETN